MIPLCQVRQIPCTALIYLLTACVLLLAGWRCGPVDLHLLEQRQMQEEERGRGGGGKGETWSMFAEGRKVLFL